VVEPEPPDQLTVEEVKSRAVHGTATLGARSLITFGLGVVANLVLARLLVPHDFGLVALGTTIIMFASFVADSGIGAALIGRTERPQRDELRAVLGFQLAVIIPFVVVFALAAAPFGKEGLVPALMLTALPLASLRLPNSLMLERELSYAPIARAEVFEAVAGFVWSIATVAAGLGVWGLASAAPVRVAVGSAVLIRRGPLGFVAPKWAWDLIRPILRFGVRFQASNVVGAVRDQGLNVGIAAVGGIATLGIWSFAYRIMNIPVLLYLSLWRVGYPAMARLLAAGENVRPVIERTIGVVAVAFAPVLVGIAASTPALLPALVGDRWDDATGILIWGCAATIVNAPVSIPCEGYMFAAGQVTRVLWAAVVGAVIWLGLALTLLNPVGASAIGLGWFVMGVVETVLLWWWVGRGAGVRILANLMGPLVVTVAAGAAGIAVASLDDEGWLIGLAGVAAGELVLLAGLLALARDPLHATVRLGRRAVTRESPA